jgi:hypothetical protein
MRKRTPAPPKPMPAPSSTACNAIPIASACVAFVPVTWRATATPPARDPHVARDQRHQARQLGAGTITRPAWMGEAIPSALAVAVAAAIRAPTDAAAHPVSMQPVLGDWPTRRAGRRARRGRCGRRQGAAHAAPFVRVTPARRLPGRSATAATRRRRRHRDQHEQHESANDSHGQEDPARRPDAAFLGRSLREDPHPDRVALPRRQEGS